MFLPILTSKLYIPHSDAIIARLHLFQRLNDGLSHKLILVAAPAGSGKTSLISAWLKEVNLPTGWLSLDAADSDPGRFISYVVAACRQVEPMIGQALLDLLQSPQPPQLEVMMTLLLDDLTNLPHNHFLLVLDDYHLITELSIHQAMRFLLDHLPPQLHVVIITREDPPFPLPQLRVRQQMTELRANDLRFTTPEIIAFFNQTVQEVTLSPTDITALERRTEGWAAGLQLAAISLQNTPDPTGFIKDFAGDNRYVVDYLLTEVLEQQPPDVLNFLQQTSILKRFTAALCQTVTTQPHAGETLAYLEKTNLFLVALDNRREWYRYHHLFGDLLSHRLRQMSPAQVSRLHRLASHWYQEQGFIDDAIHHALTGEDYDDAANLIEQVGLDMVGQARLNQLQKWIESLPKTFTSERPYLSVLLAWISVLNKQPDQAESHLALTEPAIQNLAEDTNLRLEIVCQVDMLRGYVSRLRYDLPASIAHIQQAIQFLPSHNEFLQCTAYLNLGGTYWRLGNFVAVEAPLRQAVTFLNFPDTIYPALAAVGYLANTYLQQGRLNEAVALCHHVKQQLASGRRPPLAMAYVAVELGALFYEKNELTTATENLTQALELGKNLDRIVNLGQALLMLAWIRHVTGQTDEAKTLLEQANASRPPGMAEFDYYLVRLWLAQDNLGAAGRWARAFERQRQREVPWQTLNELTFAHVLLAEKQIDQALEVLSECETIAQSAGTMAWVIRSLILKALCYQALNEVNQALALLQQALSLAEPEGYCRTVIDFGPPVQRLLQQAAVQGIAPAYVTQLLSNFPASPEDKAMVNLVEPLNDREQAILRFMAAGLSNQEIAEELYLSVNTIKWYTTHIYSKLGVNSRTKAVARGQEAGIL